MALGPGAEFDRIRAVAKALGPAGGTIGDDCVLLSVDDTTLALSTDASVEGVHFRLEWISLEEAGWRAAAAALSDLAAEGAEPAGLLAAVMAPRSSSEEDVVAVMRGVGDAGGFAGAPVLGGDLSSGPAWGVTVTVVGRVTTPVTRAGARPGDGVWVTGAVGGARAALERWRRGEKPAPEARRAFAHPVPRITAGRWLAGHGARAMIDLSDGLGADAGHLAAASRVAVELELERVPVAGDAPAEASRLGIPVQQFAAEGGEDYELLVALPGTFGPTDVAAFERACGIALTRVGSIASGRGVSAAFADRRVALQGWDHFR